MILSGLSALYFGKKAEDTLPVAVLLSMILAFAAGITGVISHILEILLLAYLFGDILFILLLRHRPCRDRCVCKDPDGQAQGKNGRGETEADGNILKAFANTYLTPGLFLFFVTSVLICFIYRNMQVLNWDDLNYWATFPRNMQAIDGVPAGALSSSLFRDYLPIIQYSYYLGFKIMGRFSEPLMFDVNNILMLLFLLPFFKRKEGQATAAYLLSLCFGILFPYLCMRQMLYCLGVDGILTCLFAYGVICVYEKTHDLFYYIRLLAVCTVLCLTKSTGVFPAVIIMLLMLINEDLWQRLKEIREKRQRGERKTLVMADILRLLYMAVTVVIPFLALLSWKLFCSLKGNHSYLGDRLQGNLSGARDTGIPSYALQVIRLYVNSFFTFHLNDGALGISPALILLLFLIVAALYLKKCGKKKRDIWSLAVILTGFLLFLLMLLYVYLFIFDEWEALSLSSYDRYITVYAGAMLYMALYGLCRMEGVFTKHFGKIAAVAILIVSAMSINYPLIYNNWNTAAFEEHNRSSLEDKAEAEEEFREWPGNAYRFGSRILIVDSEENNSKRLFARYAAVPQVVEFYALSGEDPAAGLMSFCEERHFEYIYFRRDLNESRAEELGLLSDMATEGAVYGGRLYTITAGPALSPAT
ncbi:MAG: hypothetical protein J6O55_01900 [Lachnospiraceae bacterium]|nr:hypothetical protein [Lachnospiraceae bacterium]